MNKIWILAQAPGNETAGGITSEDLDTETTGTKTEVSDSNRPVPEAPPRGFLGRYGNLVFLVLMFVMLYLILFRGPRRKQQQHRQMVQTLQKNDRVRTIGGIVGVVVDVKGDEITLKVDESNNTKIKVISSAIGKNLSKDK